METENKYTQFFNKWGNRTLYETPHDVSSASVGRISVFRCDDYKLSHIKNFKIIADVWSTPKILGWKDEKQKREFSREAKKVGLSNNKSTKNEWYKIIDLI
jgi:hypothetical protein